MNEETRQLKVDMIAGWLMVACHKGPMAQVDEMEHDDTEAFVEAYLAQLAEATQAMSEADQSACDRMAERIVELVLDDSVQARES